MEGLWACSDGLSCTHAAARPGLTCCPNENPAARQRLPETAGTRDRARPYAHGCPTGHRMRIAARPGHPYGCPTIDITPVEGSCLADVLSARSCLINSSTC